MWDVGVVQPPQELLDDTAGCPSTFHLTIDTDRLLSTKRATHAPRILLLYGSLRERSFSRLMTEEAARILTRLRAETRPIARQVCLCPTTGMRIIRR